MVPKRLTILGVGLLGGSIGLALKSIVNSCEIVGYGHRPATLERALQFGAIDTGVTDIAQAVEGSDLVILCTPVGLFENLLGQMKSTLTRGAIITDVGSTKRSIVDAAERLLPEGVQFVGSHPMAGSEKRGVEFARADLFKNALCIVTPTPRTQPKALKGVEEFWKLLGMRTTSLSPDDHDRLLADVSHLPHIVAGAIVAMQQEAALPLAGKGFMDATRIAGGDGALWRDILVDNRDYVRASLHRLRSEVDHLMALLEGERGDELAAWLTAAAQRREGLVAQKLREMNPD